MAVYTRDLIWEKLSDKYGVTAATHSVNDVLRLWQAENNLSSGRDLGVFYSAQTGISNFGDAEFKYWTDYTVFSPLDLSPAMWLDASDASTITASSGKVSQWSDKSGNGRHMTQGTGLLQPAYNETKNGKNVVTFDSTTYLNGTVWGPSRDTISIVGVIQNYNSSKATAAFMLGSNQHVGLTTKTATSPTRVGALLGNVIWLTTTTSSHTNWANLIFRRSGGVNRIRQDSIDLTISAGGASRPNAASGSMWLGGLSDGLGYWRVGEIIVLDNYYLDGTNLTNLEKYLNDKWAIY